LTYLIDLTGLFPKACQTHRGLSYELIVTSEKLRPNEKKERHYEVWSSLLHRKGDCRSRSSFRM